MLRRFITLVGALMIFGVVVRPANAQQYQLRHYGVADGLAHGAVNSIYQDRKGYIWFSTREGLSRFDGYTFVNFGERDGLGQQLINAVTEDEQGRMWVATNGGGVALFLDDGQARSGGKFKTFLINRAKDEDAKAANNVNRILCDSRNNLWALTDGGLYRASLSDPNLKFATVKSGPLPESQTPAFADSRGSLWFGYDKEVLEIRDGQFINHGAAGGQIVESISQDREGNIFVADFYSLREFVPTAGEGGQWRKIEVKLKPGQRIYSLWPASAGDMYIGTSSGLIRWNRDGKQAEINSKMLGGYTVWTLAEDRDQNIWISAWANGVYKLSGEMIVNYTDTEGQNLRAADIVEEGGVLKAVTFVDRVVEFFKGTIKSTTALEYPPNFDHSVIIYRDRGRWIASTLGSHYATFRRPAIRLRDGSELPLSAIASTEELVKGVTIYEDENRKLWVRKRTSPGKIYRGTLKPANKIAFETLTAEFQEVGYGERMIGDGAGGVWLATAEKLCRIRQGEFSCLRPTAGLPGVDPRSLFLDSRGWLWIGQRHRGVSVTKEPGAENPSFVNYSTENGLASDAAWAIIEDDEGRVYVGTGKGLSRFDPRTGGWQEFTSKDGLGGDDIKSLYKDLHGNIWIAADSVTRFNPRVESKSLQPPPVYINRLSIAGQDLALPETGTTRITPMELASSRNNVTIDFVGVQFQGEDTLLYQHKLEGADANWSAPNKLRSVNYASLSAGSYRFQVRAIDRDGLISAPAVFDFRILRPIYARWWFVTLALLALSGAAFVLYQYRVRQLLELERVRTHIASDLHDDIGASLSRVAILSEVVKRQDEVKSGTSRRMLTEIADSARGLVDAMSDIVWSIDPQRDDLRSVSARIRQFASDVLEAREIQWELKLPRELENVKLNAEQRRQILLIIKEALNNVVRHAECSHVKLSLAIEGHALAAEVRDDGRGFQLDGFDGSADNGRGGNGLRNMRARVAQLRGKLNITSSPDQGTCLKFTVPLK